MFFPLRIYKGRDSFFISMTYCVNRKSETRCQGWGVVNSSSIFSLGDRFMSSRFLSNSTKQEEQEYYFIDFACYDGRVLNDIKVLKSSLDIRQSSIDKKSIPLVIIDNNKDDMIIGLGRINFLTKKIELEMLEAIPLKILGFFV